MMILNTRNELVEFLNSNDLPSLVGVVTFGGDLLSHALANGNQIAIDDLGFADDGGWIEIDEMGIVVEDAYLP